MGFEGLGAAIASFAGSTAGEATIAGVASSAIGAGASALLNKTPSLNVPPPPGAAMVDPAGSTAAAAARRRQAVAGGLQSTQTGAGNAPASGGPTSGGKSLLGS